MSNWQPIETAPKDGTEILAYEKTEYENTQFHVVRWCEVISGWEEVSEYGCCPTHWMPLPEPPK